MQVGHRPKIFEECFANQNRALACIAAQFVNYSSVRVNILARFAQKLHGQARPIFMTCAFGIVAGGGAVAFQLAISGFYRCHVGVPVFARLNKGVPLLEAWLG